MTGFSLVVTCEHGGNRIPVRYRAFFARYRRLLSTHRSWDPGALRLAERVARALRAPLFYSRISRLLVDLNRSPHHPRLFGAAVRGLPATERALIFEAHYRPHRRAVERAIERRLEKYPNAPVLHLAVHSFTPVLDGTVRRADLGLLYDPARGGERHFCGHLASLLREADPSLRVRRNYPYLGKSDGFATALRQRFSGARYLGVEVEVNQRLSGAAGLVRIERVLLPALSALGVGVRLGG